MLCSMKSLLLFGRGKGLLWLIGAEFESCPFSLKSTCLLSILKLIAPAINVMQSVSIIKI